MIGLLGGPLKEKAGSRGCLTQKDACAFVRICMTKTVYSFFGKDDLSYGSGSGIVFVPN